MPNILTVRLLVLGTTTLSTGLLGLGTSGVRNEECSVVGNESLLQLVLGVLINELLVVGDEGLGNSLSDGVNLGNVSTTGDSDSDVELSELIGADDQEGLVKLESISIVRDHGIKECC